MPEHFADALDNFIVSSRSALTSSHFQVVKWETAATVDRRSEFGGCREYRSDSNSNNRWGE
jgi:hypothetical protein